MVSELEIDKDQALWLLYFLWRQTILLQCFHGWKKKVSKVRSINAIFSYGYANCRRNYCWSQNMQICHSLSCEQIDNVKGRLKIIWWRLSRVMPRDHFWLSEVISSFWKIVWVWKDSLSLKRNSVIFKINSNLIQLIPSNFFLVMHNHDHSRWVNYFLFFWLVWKSVKTGRPK